MIMYLICVAFGAIVGFTVFAIVTMGKMADVSMLEAENEKLNDDNFRLYKENIELNMSLKLIENSINERSRISLEV